MGKKIPKRIRVTPKSPNSKVILGLPLTVPPAVFFSGGVAVAVGLGPGVLVLVGTGVSVAVGLGPGVLVLVGIGVFVLVGVGPGGVLVLVGVGSGGVFVGVGSVPSVQWLNWR